MQFATTWMQLEIIMQSEGSQKEADKYHIISLICGMKNMTQMNQSIGQKQTHKLGEQICGPQGGGGREGMNWEFGVSRCKSLQVKWINNYSVCVCVGV